MDWVSNHEQQMGNGGIKMEIEKVERMKESARARHKSRRELGTGS
jgi:hypothetical protein